MSQTSSYNVVCFGEILWDILPDKAVPGGAPMNVAYHLHRLGERPALLTRIGIDERGKELLTIMESMNLDTTFIQLDYELPTGIVHATPNEHGEMSYEIVAPAAWDNIQYDHDVETVVKNAEYFVFGSLATRNKQSKETLYKLLEIASSKVLDINLRQPFFTRESVEELLRKCDVVKMNISELELITGWFADYKSIEERIQLIQDRFNIRSIIVTMGADGAVVNFRGNYHRHNGYKVQVADTIGSGDSFLAAFLSSVLQNKSPEEALTFASGLGALVASKSGGWPAYNISDIDSVINNTQTIQ
ncbi:carbohydrate kinase family protein [Lacibacter luteus]|nr:carbohydrate kinase [Lacibacter luteus]